MIFDLSSISPSDFEHINDDSPHHNHGLNNHDLIRQSSSLHNDESHHLSFNTHDKKKLTKNNGCNDSRDEDVPSE